MDIREEEALRDIAEVHDEPTALLPVVRAMLAYTAAREHAIQRQRSRTSSNGRRGDGVAGDA